MRKTKIIILLIITIILSFLSYGSIKEFGKSIKYPVSYAFSLQEYHGQLDKNEVFNRINDIAKNSHHIFYRESMDDNNNKTTLTLGIQDTINLKNLALNYIDMNGFYYSDNTVDNKTQKQLEQLGFRFMGASIPWFLLPLDFFLNHSSVVIWTLFISFFLLFYAIEMLYFKKYMIYRSIGHYLSILIKNFFKNIGFLLILHGLSIIIFSIIEQSISSVFTKSFALLMCCHFVLLIVLIFIVYLNLLLIIKFENIMSIIKNRSSYIRKIMSLLFLICILCLITLLNKSINTSVTISQQLNQQITTLERWQAYKSFSKILWFDEDQYHKDKYGHIDETYWFEKSKKNAEFIKLFDDNEWIYIEQSSLSTHNLEFAPNLFKEELQKNNINMTLANDLYYINAGVVSFNNVQTKVDTINNKIGIMLIPEKYKKQTNDIKNLVDYELLQHNKYTISDFEVTYIPNGQTIFNFNYSDNIQENQSDNITDAILVQINFKNLSAEKNQFASLFNQVIFNSIFNQTLVEKNVNQVALTNYSEMINVAEQKLLQKEKLESQLTGMMISLAILSIAQIFIIYEYITLTINTHIKRIVINKLLGKNVVAQILRQLYPLFIIILLSIVWSLIQYNHYIVYTTASILILEMLVMIVFVIFNIKKKQVQILKGDFEVL